MMVQSIEDLKYCIKIVKINFETSFNSLEINQ